MDVSRIQFSRVWEVLDGGMNYGWMLVSLVFGVFSHIFRGWRWKLTLAPLGEHPKTSDCVYAIFVSYAANLVVPRVGEIPVAGCWLNMMVHLFPNRWVRWLRNG